MSEIAGFVGPATGPADLGAVTRMMAALPPREGSSPVVRQIGTASFGCRRLATTPEAEGGGLPLSDGPLLLTADLRLDNRGALIRELGAHGCVTDGGLVLRAYEKWGASFAEHLEGDFAIAVHDGARRTLVCARDPLGMKELFYWTDGATVAFGSEIKMLLALEEVRRELNPERVRDHLLGLPGDAGVTFYRDVRRLPPASVLTVGPDGVAVVREYWRLDPTRELPPSTDDELLDQFRSLFADAVSCRLRSAGPVGATLSGGLDSSAIVCVARAVIGPGPPLHTFSLRFEEAPECDEGEFIELVREPGGLVGHDVPGDGGSPLEEMLSLFEELDEPTILQNLHLAAGTFRAAAALGIRVMLDGHDGDTAIAKDAPQRAAQGRRRSLLGRFAGALSQPRSSWSSLRSRLRPPRGAPEVAPGLLSLEFARRCGAEERLERFRRANAEAIAAGGRTLHSWRLMNGYPRYASEAMRSLGNVFGIEPRHPFYDRRLLELCLALPASWKNRDGFTRFVVRRALEGDLPAAIAWRPGKTDLSPQFHRGFRSRDRDAIRRALRESRALLEPFVDVTKAEECHRRYLESSDPESASRVWSAVTLALWLRRAGISS